MLTALALAVAALFPWLYVGAFAGDAQVHLVFAESFAHGQPFAFNPGEPVAGETSPGYMLLGAAFYGLLPASAVPIALKAIGLFAWYGLVALVYRAAARALGDTRWALAAAIAFALMPGAAYNATCGMENGLFATAIWLWLDLAACWRWLEGPIHTDAERSGRRELGLGVLLAGTTWLRPEGALVALAAHAYRCHKRAGSEMPMRWLVGLGPVVAAGVASLAFQFTYTDTLVATSIASRRIAAMEGSLRLGSALLIDPRFALRLAFYWPLSLLFLASFLRTTEPSSMQTARPFPSGSIEGLGLVLLMVFFVVFTFVTGAVHLARYTIFVMPVLVIGAARGARRIWRGEIGRLGPRPRLIVAIAVGLALCYGVEVWARERSYSADQLATAVTAPARRTRRTSELLAALGRSGGPVVLAYESIEIRYELDDRAVVRSLDGRADPVLLAHVFGGRIDYLGYLRQRQVDFLMQLPASPAGRAQPVMGALAALPSGGRLVADGWQFRRIGTVYGFAITSSGR